MKRILALGLGVLCAAPALAASDDFDRATLGKKWVVVDGTLSIANNQLVGSDTALGYFKRSRSDITASALVTLPNANLQYGAVAIGDIATAHNAFVKIQNNGDATFSFGAFYEGDNGAGNFFALTSPVPSPATLQVTLCGTVAKMTIKSSAKTQKYAYDYGADGNSFGTGAGLGTFGNVTLDNYQSKPGGRCTLDADTVMIKGPGLADPTKAK